MIYLGLSLFLLVILAVARKPLYTIIDFVGKIFMESGYWYVMSLRCSFDSKLYR